MAAFPQARSYLDVYERFGLLGAGSVFAHCIHLDAQDRTRLLATRATVAHCPTSNLFLGSGLMDLRGMLDEGQPVALASDVGGGTSFSVLATMAAAYQVAQLRGGWTPSVASLLYLATLAGARAMAADDLIGNFAPGKEADFVLLDPAATPLIARRCELARSVDEKLFVLMTLGDDLAVSATYVMGEAACGIS
jgi:guanine deaminase